MVQATVRSALNGFRFRRLAQRGLCAALRDQRGVSHDAVNRFLNREAYSVRVLFEAAPLGCFGRRDPSVDHTILEKPYSYSAEGKTRLLG